MALLVGICASIPGELGAQEREAPPSEEKKEEPPAEEAPSEEKKDEIVTEGVDGEDWITPDVGAAEEEAEEDAIGDVDEVVIEYGASPDMKEDSVKDAEGKEIEESAGPVVSKTVEVQDPSKLEQGADKETGVQGQVVSGKPKKVLPDAPVLAKGKDDGKLRSTITDERGRYRLYLPPGKYTLIGSIYLQGSTPFAPTTTSITEPAGTTFRSPAASSSGSTSFSIRSRRRMQASKNKKSFIWPTPRARPPSSTSARKRSAFRTRSARRRSSGRVTARPKAPCRAWSASRSTTAAV